MKIYTLYYKDTGLYNRSIFVIPNDEAAKKAIKLNLMDSRAEQFRNEAKLGNVILKCLCEFYEEKGLIENEGEYEVCNIKDLLNDNNGNLESAQSDNT